MGGNDMTRITAIAAGLAIGLAALQYSQPASSQSEGGWTTLVSSSSMGDWDRVGNANWSLASDGLVANKLDGKDLAYLVSKTPYKDFEIRAEFWTDAEANSGIFLRCNDPKVIDGKTCYEVNIFDKRPDPSYGTGAIVDVAKVDPMPKAADQWNTYLITARGPHLTVTLNGKKTVEVDDTKHASGPIALQYGSGLVKFRKVEIRPL
jgi:hypothetical protein